MMAGERNDGGWKNDGFHVWLCMFLHVNEWHAAWSRDVCVWMHVSMLDAASSRRKIGWMVSAWRFTSYLDFTYKVGVQESETESRESLELHRDEYEASYLP